MTQMSQRVTNVNKTLVGLTEELRKHSDKVQDNLKTVEGNVEGLEQKMAALESNPPSIGEVRREGVREGVRE